MKKLLVSLSALAVFAIGAIAAEEEEEAEFSAVCPVSGKDALEDKTVEYRGATVYFCCENCPKAFEADTEKYATKANHQLFATEQAELVKCPLTGRALNAAQTVEVSGVEVTFCCPNCKGKVARESGDDQLALVFADAAFDKGFEIPEADEDE